MTPEIESWVKTVARRHIVKPGNVLEIGALDVNGNVRQYFPDATTYIGTDMQEGPNVDLVMDNNRLLYRFLGKRFDTIIACEVLEHDMYFWETVDALRILLADDGYLIITTPTFGFPLHRYPRDYWRFGEDAYREVFFEGLNILDIRHLDNQAGKGITLVGIAQNCSERD